jgi:hypothetical protein
MDLSMEKKRGDLELEIHTYERAKRQQPVAYIAAIVGAGMLALGLVYSVGSVFMILGIALIVVGIVSAAIGEVGGVKLSSLRRQLDELDAGAPSTSMTASSTIVKSARFCRSCGHELPPDSDFCEGCGKKLGG